MFTLKACEYPEPPIYAYRQNIWIEQETQLKWRWEGDHGKSFAFSVGFSPRNLSTSSLGGQGISGRVWAGLNRKSASGRLLQYQLNYSPPPNINENHQKLYVFCAACLLLLLIITSAKILVRSAHTPLYLQITRWVHRVFHGLLNRKD